MPKQRALPGFRKRAELIQSWVWQGHHRQPETYVQAVQRLAELLHLPVTPQFCSLRPAVGGAPLVEVMER